MEYAHIMNDGRVEILATARVLAEESKLLLLCQKLQN